MKSVRTRAFRKQFERLPQRIQKRARRAFQRFVEDPRHDLLKNRPLHDTDKGRHRDGSRSVNIGRDYRAIYYKDGDTAVWYWIGSHEDYNNFLGG